MLLCHGGSPQVHVLFPTPSSRDVTIRSWATEGDWGHVWRWREEALWAPRLGSQCRVPDGAAVPGETCSGGVGPGGGQQCAVWTGDRGESHQSRISCAEI